MGLLNMLVPCFDLLHVSLILQVWREVYYCHFIMIIFGTAIFYTVKPILAKPVVVLKEEKTMTIEDIVESLEVMKTK